MNEIFKYVVAGVVNTVVGYGVFWISLRGLRTSPEAANAIGYIMALCIAFILNKFFVFTNSRISLHTIIRFIVSFMAAFMLNQGVIICLVRIYSVLPEVAQGFAMFTYTVSFYVFNKYFVFVDCNCNG